MNMKKTLLTATILAGSLAFGAANDTVLVFSTKGPDTYGDGSTVLDGERYALVWTKDGTAFAGLTADCKPLADTTKVIAVAPLAKGGKCPETVFEIDADYAETFKGGSFALYLLDTRVKGADGKVTLASESGGEGTRRPTTVNAAGVASLGGDAVRTETGAVGSVKAGAVSLATVGVYAKIGEPKITAMKVEGAAIELKVSGMSAAADYFVVHGTTPGDVAEKLETTVVDRETLKAAKPASAAGFFKVLGVRLFQ